MLLLKSGDDGCVCVSSYLYLILCHLLVQIMRDVNSYSFACNHMYGDDVSPENMTVSWLKPTKLGERKKALSSRNNSKAKERGWKKRGGINNVG